MKNEVFSIKCLKRAIFPDVGFILHFRPPPPGSHVIPILPLNWWAEGGGWDRTPDSGARHKLPAFEVTSKLYKRTALCEKSFCAHWLFNNLQSLLWTFLAVPFPEGGVGMTSDLLYNKRVLVVDDEPDVLNIFGELLHMCDVIKASSFDEARKALEGEYFDIAILDIMGVNGYRLLEIANSRDIIAIMLTAHALSPEDTEKSFKEGAAFFVPKEKLSEIPAFLSDVVDAKLQFKNTWSKWMESFGASYDKKFGSGWKTKAKELIGKSRVDDLLIK
jgi:CheY-like chemotaxis protein